jgi:hypothetical protein
MRFLSLESARLPLATVGLMALALAQAVAQSPEQAALSAAMKGAKLTLEQGLRASEQKGKPISAKFEIDDKKLQLSVYTVAGDGFAEVVVDSATGAVKSTEKISDSEDLKAAAAQKAAMDNATVSLVTATEKAMRDNPGAQAVSIFPDVRYGQPVADVTLLLKDSFVKVTEKLN